MGFLSGGVCTRMIFFLKRATLSSLLDIRETGWWSSINNRERFKSMFGVQYNRDKVDNYVDFDLF